MQEEICQKFIEEYNFQIMITRSFNHTGPGQIDSFAIPSFAHQIVAIERDVQQKLLVGNLQAIRDFSDVRDVVRAYHTLLLQGKSGEKYNVCTGKGYTMQYLLDTLVSYADVDVKIEVDSSRLRPSDIPELIGDNSKIKTTTGWSPEIPLEQTLKNVLEYWRGKN